MIAARHACLEVQDSVSFIANDVTMVQGVRVVHVLDYVYWIGLSKGLC